MFFSSLLDSLSLSVMIPDIFDLNQCSLPSPDSMPPIMSDLSVGGSGVGRTDVTDYEEARATFDEEYNASHLYRAALWGEDVETKTTSEDAGDDKDDKDAADLPKGRKGVKRVSLADLFSVAIGIGECHGLEPHEPDESNDPNTESTGGTGSGSSDSIKGNNDAEDFILPKGVKRISLAEFERFHGLEPQEPNGPNTESTRGSSDSIKGKEGTVAVKKKQTKVRCCKPGTINDVIEALEHDTGVNECQDDDIISGAHVLLMDSVRVSAWKSTFLRVLGCGGAEGPFEQIHVFIVGTMPGLHDPDWRRALTWRSVCCAWHVAFQEYNREI